MTTRVNSKAGVGYFYFPQSLERHRRNSKSNFLKTLTEKFVMEPGMVSKRHETIQCCKQLSHRARSWHSSLLTVIVASVARNCQVVAVVVRIEAVDVIVCTKDGD